MHALQIVQTRSVDLTTILTERRVDTAVWCFMCWIELIIMLNQCRPFQIHLYGLLCQTAVNKAILLILLRPPPTVLSSCDKKLCPVTFFELTRDWLQSAIRRLRVSDARYPCNLEQCAT